MRGSDVNRSHLKELNSYYSDSTSSSALELVEDTIQRIHGVNYRQHVQRLFSVAFGANRLAAIESKLKEVAKFEQLKADLGSVQKSRNELAHTYTQVTSRIDAPEVTLKRFERLHRILNEIQTFGLEEA